MKFTVQSSLTKKEDYGMIKSSLEVENIGGKNKFMVQTDH